MLAAAPPAQPADATASGGTPRPPILGPETVGDNPTARPDLTDGATDKLANQGKAWSADADAELYASFRTLDDVPTLAAQHQRTTGGIIGRLRRLRLIDAEGQVIDPKPPFQPKVRRLRPPGAGARRGRKIPTAADATEQEAFDPIRRLSSASLVTALEVLRGLALLDAARARHPAAVLEDGHGAPGDDESELPDRPL